MTELIWSETYSVHIASVDEQHRHLLRLLNALSEGLDDGSTKEQLGMLLTDLLEYSAQHFADEERLFVHYDYPRAEEHVAEHRELTERVKEFRLAFERGKTSVALELLAFLRNWLSWHIQRSDRAFGAHVLSQRSSARRTSH